MKSAQSKSPSPKATNTFDRCRAVSSSSATAFSERVCACMAFMKGFYHSHTVTHTHALVLKQRQGTSSRGDSRSSQLLPSLARTGPRTPLAGSSSSTHHHSKPPMASGTSAGGGGGSSSTSTSSGGAPESLLVVVGSGNPCKVNAVRDAFALVYPTTKLRVEGVEVESGVSCQPFSDLETYRGALTRARNAAAAWRGQAGEAGAAAAADFAVGLEGGVKEEDELEFGNGQQGEEEEGERLTRRLHCFAWMVVLEPSTGKVGAAKTGSFPLPRPVAELVRQGVELGHADDQVFKRTNSKQGDGVVGILTKGVIDRAVYYSHALVLALIPFQHREMY